MEDLKKKSLSLYSWYKAKSWFAQHLSQPLNASIMQQKQNQTNTNKKFSQFPLQKNIKDTICRIGIYAFEGIQALVILVIITCFITPVFQLQYKSDDLLDAKYEVKFKINQACIAAFLVLRAGLALGYVLWAKIRNNYFYLPIKAIQTISVALFRLSTSNRLYFLLCVILIIQSIAEFVYIYCKEQRLGYFDSRLEYQYYLTRRLFRIFLLLQYNTFQRTLQHMLLVLLLFVAVNCFCVAFDSIYSLLTRNMLLIYWVIITIDVVYFNILQYLTTEANILSSQIVAHCFIFGIAIIILILCWMNKEWIGILTFHDFSKLQIQFKTLRSKNAQSIYLWQAIRFLSIQPKNLYKINNIVHNINWVLSRSMTSTTQMSTVKNKKAGQSIQELMLQFHNRFKEHCYRLMLQNFKSSKEVKYMFIFYFNERSAEKVLLYLNKKNFFDIRQRLRIQKQHKNSDIASKVSDMHKTQVQIHKTAKQYISKLKNLSSLMFQNSGIDLNLCKKYGDELLQIQNLLLSFGIIQHIEQDQLNVNSVDVRRQEVKKSTHLLSKYSRYLLNIIRTQMFGVPQLPPISRSLIKDETAISQMMNLQQSLILISAQQQSLGQIVALNQSASKLTCYSENQLIGKNLNILLPQAVKNVHSKILSQNSFMYKKSQKKFSFKSIVYIVKKNKYCALCTTFVRFIDGSMGKRWMIKLKQIQPSTPFIICDSFNKIIGINQSALSIGIGFSWLNVNIGEQIINRLDNQLLDSQILGVQLLDKKKKKSIVIPLKQLKMKSNYSQVSKHKATLNKITQNTHTHPNTKININKSKNNVSLKIIQSQQKHDTHINLNENEYDKSDVDEILIQCSIMNKTQQLNKKKILGYYIIKMIKNQRCYIAQEINKQSFDGSIQIQDHYQYLRNTKHCIYSKKKKQRNSGSSNYDSNLQNPPFQFQFCYQIGRNAYYNYRKQIGSEIVKSQVELQNSSNVQNFLSQNSRDDGKLKKSQHKIRFDDQPDFSQSYHSQKQQKLIEKDKAVEADQINQLIYINGQLQFRQNKRLQQKHQCDTHPLHLNHRFSNDPYDDKLKTLPVQSKKQIYQLLNDSTYSDTRNNQPNTTKYRSKQQKILTCILAIFFISGCAFSISGVVLCKNIIMKQNYKLNTQLIMSERAALYNDLATNFNNFIIQNLGRLINDQKMMGIQDVTQIVGSPTYWFDIVKQIIAKSSDINAIDSIQVKWHHSTLTRQIPTLATSIDFISQSDILFVNLLSLQAACKQHPNVKYDKNNTIINIDNQVLSLNLLVLSNLIQQIIPMNIYVIFDVANIYNQSINLSSTLVNIFSAVYGVITFIVALVSFVQIRQIQKIKNKNLELISYFPIQYVQDFNNKLKIFQKKIDDGEDILSQIGLEQLNFQIPPSDQLLLHKKKLNRKGSNIKLISFVSLIAFILIGSSSLVLVQTGIQSSLLISRLQQWFYLSNGHILQLNYRWHQQIIKKGINQVQQVNKYFNKNPFNNVSVEHIFKNRNYLHLLKFNYQSIKQGTLSNNFAVQVDSILGKNFCQYIQNQLNQTQLKCQEFVSQFALQMIQGYIQLKQFIIGQLKPSSIQKQKADKFESILKFFDNRTAKYNEKNLFANNKLIIQEQLDRMVGLCYFNIITGLSIVVLLTIAISVIYLWFTNKSAQYMNKPLLVMTRSFPLLALNHNQQFINWYHARRNQYLR